MRSKKIRVLGVTGGVGCGKSSVLEYLEKYCGMYVIQADLVSRELIRADGCCFGKVVDLLGRDILAADGEIDRGKMAAAIFARQELREQINAIIHPAVKTHILELIHQAEERGSAYAVVEAALLLEAHYEEFIDEYWYIYAPEDVRRMRLRESRGYSDGKITSIMRAQLTEEEFRSGCQVVIDNGGSFERTIEQIKALLKREENYGTV